MLKENDKQFVNVLKEVSATSNIKESRKYIQHGDTSVYDHSILVALYSYRLAKKLRIKCDYESLIRGALLHDYFLYDWHENEKWHKWHGFRHPDFALRNAEAIYNLTDKEKNIIKRHMFPLTIIPPTCKEGIIVCLVDKYCAIKEMGM